MIILFFFCIGGHFVEIQGMLGMVSQIFYRWCNIFLLLLLFFPSRLDD